MLALSPVEMHTSSQYMTPQRPTKTSIYSSRLQYHINPTLQQYTTAKKYVNKDTVTRSAPDQLKSKSLYMLNTIVLQPSHYLDQI